MSVFVKTIRTGTALGLGPERAITDSEVHKLGDGSELSPFAAKSLLPVFTSATPSKQLL